MNTIGVTRAELGVSDAAAQWRKGAGTGPNNYYNARYYMCLTDKV